MTYDTSGERCLTCGQFSVQLLNRGRCEKCRSDEPKSQTPGDQAVTDADRLAYKAFEEWAEWGLMQSKRNFQAALAFAALNNAKPK